MKYKLRGLNCDMCNEDIIKHISQIKGLSKVLKQDGEIFLESDGKIKEETLLNNIKEHLKHIGHEHSIEIFDEYTIYLKGLNCSNCSKKIEDATKKLKWVDSANYDFASEKFRLFINTKADKEYIFREVNLIVKRIEPDVVVEKDEDLNKEEISIFKYKKEFLKLGIILVCLLTTIKVDLSMNFKLPIYIILYLITGHSVVIRAFKNMIKGDFFDEKFLMSVATLGAFMIGEYPEAVAVMLFFGIGELFEDIALERSRYSISKALTQKPEYANLLTGEKVSIVDPKEIKVGDLILIKAGEKIPLDGIVVEGNSYIDTSNITGEAIPRSVKSGDEVISGCINKDGVLKVKVTSIYENTTIAKILDFVENAANRKSKTEKLITRFSKIYTPIVVLMAIFIAVVLPLTGIIEFKDGLTRAFTFLVISCPCALVISVPLGVFGGIGAASKSGIFVKGGNYLENLSEISNIVFDKTGTITKGVFEVTEIKPVNNFSKDELLKLAVFAEKHSNHPIALAIIQKANNIFGNEEIENLKEHFGKGLSYTYNGEEILVGNEKLLIENKIAFEKNTQMGVKVYVAKGDKFVGTIVVSDKLKDNIKEDIKKIRSMGIVTTILSGDINENVKQIANEVGIDNFYGELLPTDKVYKLEEIMKKADKKVAFVGDGVNDAPVLARADIGIAMGSVGSDSAIEAADVVLITDEISKIVQGIRISKNTKRIVYQNVFFAIFIKLLVLVLGALGIVSMWAAVFADVGVTVIAVLNSIRALKVPKDL